MKPDKKKWTAAIKKIMHDDYVIVGALNSIEDLEHYTIGDYFHLARIGSHYLLGLFRFGDEDDYEWIDSAQKVKDTVADHAHEANGEESLASWHDPELVDSIKDSAPLFGEEWNPDDIVREIQADENFRIRILCPDEEIPEEYEY